MELKRPFQKKPSKTVAEKLMKKKENAVNSILGAGIRLNWKRFPIIKINTPTTSKRVMISLS